MEKIIEMKFKLREDYYEYGRVDALNGIFDTAYLERTDDSKLSYLAGWSQVKIYGKLIMI